MDASVKAVIVMAAIFAVSQLGALAMVSSALGEEYQAFENPNDPMIPVYYVIAIVLFTFAVLYIIKKKRENIVRFIFIGAVGFTIFYVILIVAAMLGSGILALALSIGLTAVLVYCLLKRPEWYVIDATGILVAVGVIGILGISLNILPVLILLIVLAAYDAISVYGTKHMVALADGVTEMKLPILLVIPKRKGYSYLRQRPLREQLEEGSEREAMFMGLGDVIIPGILVSSAFSFLSDEQFAGVPSNLLVALGALAGGLIGFALLMRYVLKGNPQAGLPLLNGGTVLGYVVSYLLVFQDLSLGISLSW
jgi:presenilin-like A22 family membrane protease